MRIRVLESAKQDLRKGWTFYENQSIGLGDYFLDSVQADVRSLVVFAGTHLRVGDYYRILCKRFPFAIYDMIENGRADIYAILDNRRDPDWIIGRLRSPDQL